VEPLADRAQPYPLPFLHRQSSVQGGFEKLHMLAYRTNRYAQMLRSSRDAAVVSDRFEYLQGTQRRQRTHFLGLSCFSKTTENIRKCQISLRHLKL
jgi:hypothetical protein